MVDGFIDWFTGGTYIISLVEGFKPLFGVEWRSPDRLDSGAAQNSEQAHLRSYIIFIWVEYKLAMLVGRGRDGFRSILSCTSIRYGFRGELWGS